MANARKELPQPYVDAAEWKRIQKLVLNNKLFYVNRRPGSNNARRNTDD